ncbi:hypothetical protein [uncultured Arcobacter sp.]|nr:hypothetical protein [uncultured Arcobacter sp.]
MIEKFRNDLVKFLDKWGLKEYVTEDYDPLYLIVGNDSVKVEVKIGLGGY